jgi:hypothetical protein
MERKERKELNNIFGDIVLVSPSAVESRTPNIESAFKIVDTILEASEDIAVISKVEEYEKILSEKGRLEEVYENLSGILYPLINLDERTLILISRLGEKMQKKVFQWMQNEKVHPLKALYHFLLGNEWYISPRQGVAFVSEILQKNKWTIISSDTLLPWKACSQNQGGQMEIGFYVDEYWKDYDIKCQEHPIERRVKMGEDCMEIGVIDYEKPPSYYISGDLEEALKGVNVFKIQIEEPEATIKLLLEEAYNAIIVSEKELANIYGTNSYRMIREAIEAINKERQSWNERKLCRALQNAVRYS